MKVFVAGATGVLGIRLVPLLDIDDAARRTAHALDEPSGIIELVDTDGTR